MLLATFLEQLEHLAPLSFAESWDNVGLLVGDPAQQVSLAMLCIDYTPSVANEAKEKRCDLIIAYHPPIFDAIKRVTASGSTGLIFDAIRRGIAIYSPHTALDVADGGTNDMLADVLELRDRRPLRAGQPKAAEFKLVTFVPEDALEKVSNALFDAGAGRIGNYSSCSFRSEGTGTFFGEEGTNPTVGETGKLEEAKEIRIETVVPISKIDAIIRALKANHPYEEPAFDLQQLAAAPTGKGLGRIGKLPGEVTADMLINRIKRELKIDRVLVAGDATKLVRTAAVCAGACGDLLNEAIAAKVDLYLTGEMRHHDALKAANAGITVVCTLHSNSERTVLRHLADRLKQAAPAMEFLLSQMDRDPFEMQ